MEKGAAEAPGEEQDKEALLRQEEQVTGLLVTIVHLQGRLQHLQRRTAREETSADLASEPTDGLPRCLPPSTSRTRSLPPPPPPEEEEEEGQADLFLQVKKAVTSLESVVLSFRTCISRMEGDGQGATAECSEGPPDRRREFYGGNFPVGLDSDPRASRLAEERDGRRREAVLCEERSAALRAALAAREEELSRAEAALSAYREERQNLQRKVMELQEALGRVELWSDDGAPGPAGDRRQRRLKDLEGAAHNTRHSSQVTPSPQPAGVISSPTSTEPQERLGQLHGSLERLWGLNQLLSAMLQESKEDAEQLSLLLGCRESDHTALLLAVQRSNRCVEAYELLLALTVRERDWNPEADGAAPWAGRSSSPNLWVKQLGADEASWPGQRGQPGTSPGTPEEEARNRLRECIGRLRAELRLFHLPTPGPCPGRDSAAARLTTGIEARLAAVRRAAQEAIPAPQQPPMEKAQLHQELLSTRVALADLGARLHLAAKETRGLQLRVDPLRAQEAAQLLMIRTLQQELRDFGGSELPPSPGGSGNTSRVAAAAGGRSEGRGAGGPEKAAEGLAEAEPEALTLQLLATWTRNRQWGDRLWALLAELEERSDACKAREAQETELLRDFLKAHCNLLLAYRRACRKQDAQLGQMEAQVALKSRRQARKVQALMDTLRQLEGQAP